MSTTPTISQVVVLPTLAVSLAITPPTSLVVIGGAVTSYTVTIDGGTLASPLVLTNQEFSSERSFHFIKGLGESTLHSHRGETLGVRVVANGSGGSTSASGSVDASMTPQCSRGAVIRQRVFDILETAAISFGGDTVRIQGDDFGRPRMWHDNKPVGKGGAFVEVGMCYDTSEENETEPVGLLMHEMPMRVFCLVDEDDEQEHVCALAEKVRSEIYALTLCNSGVSDLAWSWKIGPPQRSQNLAVITQTMTTPPQYIERGAALF